MQAHPDARSYRVKAVPCYHKLCVIYGHDKLEGGYNSLADSIAPTTETPGMRVVMFLFKLFTCKIC